MTIMRSPSILVFCGKSVKKVRRKRVDWFKVMVDLGNPEIEHIFISFIGRLYRGKSLSKRRCAYYSLKNTTPPLLSMNYVRR